MGSTGIYTTKSFKEVFEDEFVNRHDAHWTCLAHSQKGNVNYSVWDIATKEGETKRTILIVKFSRYGGEVVYKDMDIGSGPYYYDIPVKLFKLFKAGNVYRSEYADKWVATVEANLAKENNPSFKFQAGTEFRLTGYGEKLEGVICKVVDLKSHTFIVPGYGNRPIKLKGFKKQYHVKEIIG